MEIQLLDGELKGILVEPDATHLRGIQLRSGTDIFSVLNDATQSRRLAVELAQQKLLVLKGHVEKIEEPTDVALWIHRTNKDTRSGWHNPYKGKMERPAGAGMHIAEIAPTLNAAQAFWIQHGMEKKMEGQREHLKKDSSERNTTEIALAHRMLLGAYLLFESKGMGKQLTDAILQDLPRLQTDKREPGDMTVLTENVVHRVIAPADFKGRGFAEFHTDVFGLHALYRPHVSEVPLIISFPGEEGESDAA